MFISGFSIEDFLYFQFKILPLLSKLNQFWFFFFPVLLISFINLVSFFLHYYFSYWLCFQEIFQSLWIIPDHVSVLAPPENDTLAGWYFSPLTFYRCYFTVFHLKMFLKNLRLVWIVWLFLFLWVEVYGGGEKTKMIATCFLLVDTIEILFLFFFDVS